MSIVLKLKHGESGTQLDFMAGSSSGFQLSGRGWAPAVATPVYMGEPAPVLETISLLLSSSNHNNMASSMQYLHQMQVWAETYMKDSTKNEPVWLHAKMNAETGERRVLVRSIGVQYKSSWFGNEATAEYIPLVITVLRNPYWENPTVRDMPQYAPTADVAHIYDYTAAGASVGAHDISGDVGARLRYFDIYGGPGGGDIYGKFWMGLRSAVKHGTGGLTNFDPYWEFESGTLYTDVTHTADSSASNGYKARVTESALNWDDEWHPACWQSASIPASGLNEADYMGMFLWLLRCKVTSGTWEVKLHFYGYEDDADTYVESPIFEIDETAWRWKEMAVQPIGVIDTHAFFGDDVYDEDVLAQMKVVVYAQRTSGTGSLDIDLVFPVPVDEGFCKLQTAGSETDADNFVFAQSPEGTVQAQDRGGGGLIALMPIDFVNFTLPPGDGRLYIVHEGLDGSDITDNIRLNTSDAGKYYERWMSLRGAE